MRDHKAQELPYVNPKSTFFWVKAHVLFAELSKDLFQVCHVLGYALRLENHVIDIDLNVSSDLMLENLVHQSLVCSAYIFKAKGHDPVAKVGIFSDECHFLLVWSMHSNLVVSRVGVQEA